MRLAPRLFTLALAMLLLLALAGCRESAQPTPTALPPNSTDQAVNVNVRVEPSPSMMGEAQLVVTVTEDNGATPVTGLTVSARGDMTHAGMTPVLGTGVEGDPGVYTIPWQWTMGGDWTVDVTLVAPDGTQTVETIAVTVGG